MATQNKVYEHTLTLSSCPATATSGKSFPARLAYRTFGDSSNPAVLLPTCYGGTIASTSAFLWDDASVPAGSPKVLDTAKYFVIIVGLLGGSESSSPSNTPAPFSGADFPRVTYEDNINLQYALCTQALGVKRLHAYIGFSMGGQQSYHAAILYPAFVERFVCIAGSARTSWHNFCFLEGPRTALEHSEDWHGGRYSEQPVKGKKAFARVWSAWMVCPEWFQERCWEKLGHETVEDWLVKSEEDGLGAWDGNDLLALLRTWQMGDVTLYNTAEDDRGDPSRGRLGNLEKAFERIQAKGLIMPTRTDQYFPWQDNEREVKLLGEKGTLAVVPTIYGHIGGGGGGTAEDAKFMIDRIAAFLK